MMGVPDEYKFVGAFSRVISNLRIRSPMLYHARRGRMVGMKAISASIVVLSGAVILSVGACIRHGDTSIVICLIGSLVGAAGIAGWIGAMIGKFD
jgi:hypothetical protein